MRFSLEFFYFIDLHIDLLSQFKCQQIAEGTITIDIIIFEPFNNNTTIIKERSFQSMWVKPGVK